MVDTVEKRVISWIQRRAKTAAAALALTATSVASAATITWQPSVDMYQGSTVETFVDTTGTTAVAYNNNTGATNATVNGVLFTGTNNGVTLVGASGESILINGGTDNGTAFGDGEFSSNADIFNLIRSGTFNITSVTLGGLDVGTPYAIQAFNNDARGSRNSNFITGYGDGTGSVAPVGTSSLNNSPGGPTVGDSIIGTFTADSATQTFNLFGSSNGGTSFAAANSQSQINAIQLRALRRDGDWIVDTDGAGTAGSHDGNWSDSANWASGDIAEGPDAVADFETNTWDTSFTVNLDVNATVGRLFYRDSGGVNRDMTLSTSNGSVLTLDGDTIYSTPIIHADTRNLFVEVVIAGNDGLEINPTTGDNDGAVWLRAANTYTGGTTVGDAGPAAPSGGSPRIVVVDTGGVLGFGDVLVRGNTGDAEAELRLNHHMAIRNTSALTIETGGNVDLNHNSFESTLVQALTLGGVTKGPGTYNATTDAAFLSGVGNIVTPADGDWGDDFSFIKRWSDPDSWKDKHNIDGVGDVAFGEDQVADFHQGGINYTNDQNVNIDADIIIGEIIWRDSGNGTLSDLVLQTFNDHTLTMAASTGTPLINSLRRNIEIEVVLDGNDGVQFLSDVDGAGRVILRETAIYTGGTIIGDAPGLASSTAPRIVRVEADGQFGSGDVLVKGTNGDSEVELELRHNEAIKAASTLILEEFADVELDYSNSLFGIADASDLFVHSLVLDGVILLNGVYNSSTHGDFLSGTGDIVVTGVPTPAALPAGLAMIMLTLTRRKRR